MLVNGDFQSGSTGSAPTGWTLDAGNYDLNSAGYLSSFPTVALDLGTFESSQISQQITVVAGTMYTLSLESYDHRSLLDSTVSHQFTVDGNTFDVLSPGSQTIETQSFNFTATASGPTMLTLATAGGPSPDANNWIDNICIAPVPEPSSALLLGIAGMSLTLRRKRA